MSLKADVAFLNVARKIPAKIHQISSQHLEASASASSFFTKFPCVSCSVF